MHVLMYHCILKFGCLSETYIVGPSSRPMGTTRGVMGTLPGQPIVDDDLHLLNLSGFAFTRDAAPVIDDTEGEGIFIYNNQ